MASIGVAIIGSGLFAKESHLPAVQACSQFSLKAIYSRSSKSAKALAETTESVDLYSDDSGSGKTYHDLLLRDDIAAVIIALPILVQPEFIEAALLAGKHVLSEKPIAADIKRAEKLINFYDAKIDKTKVNWSVAENFRYLDSYVWASQEVAKLGKVVDFRTKMFANVQPGAKYYETEWRKKPEYQGGFLLDGGVHFIAATRLLLGAAAQPAALSAYTALLLPHLPPVDSVNAIWRTTSGVSGTFSVSFGTTLSGSEYTVACERGSVSCVRGRRAAKVVVREGEEKDGRCTEKHFEHEGSGVEQEITAWARALTAGKADPRQSPQEALADLEILEKMLKSGEAEGQPIKLVHQF